jgi:molecular chaperone DnaJ
MARDFYEILGVTKGASDDEIKKAYRKLAHQHHPDKKGGDEAKFKEINEAYQVLSDKSKRAQYDQFGQTFNQGGFSDGGQPGGGFGGFDFGGFSRQGGTGGFNFEFGGEDLGDIFSDIFGGGFSGGSRRTRKKAGRDIQVDAEISFSEMVRGAKRKINLYKSAVCQHCEGTGGEPGVKQETCPTCKGSGQVRQTVSSFFGTFTQAGVCPQCQGSGKIFKVSCRECGGDGKVKREEEIEINIPAGIQDGQTISIEGGGEAGERGARPGNLFINVHILPHEKFKREGENIISDEKITFSQAVLGDKIDVETIDGPMRMKIPSGTQSGEVFRIRDKGVPHLGKRGQGDQLVKIIVDIPKHLSREQKRLIEELGELDK